MTVPHFTGTAPVPGDAVFPAAVWPAAPDSPNGRSITVNDIVEPFGPDYVRPQQADCPNCLCCTAPLCEKGRRSPLGCRGSADPVGEAVVARCPCSSDLTHGTLPWRIGRMVATRHAREMPLDPGVEEELRAVAAGRLARSADRLARLVARRYVVLTGSGPAVTALGRAYLAGRDDLRLVTMVQVERVDAREGIAVVVVAGWSRDHAVTVPLVQLTEATGLRAEELPGRRLQAEANCRTEQAHDVILTRVQLAPPLVQMPLETPPGGDQ